LKERDIWIVGADERAEKTIYESELPAAIAWVLGAEGEGMRRLTRERCDLLVRIPMRGSVESLNVSVASGVCLFESRRDARSRAAVSQPAAISSISDAALFDLGNGTAALAYQ